ncbi:MAG: hypothetical protein Q8N04_06650 [Nitrospira sp.]|nr:hypothetical protein [Nitrospira sp.]
MPKLACDRYFIVNKTDPEWAVQSLTACFEREKAKAVTPTKVEGERSNSVGCKEVESSADFMDLARGIEPPTCGLQIAPDPFSAPSSITPKATESHEEWPG